MSETENNKSSFGRLPFNFSFFSITFLGFLTKETWYSEDSIFLLVGLFYIVFIGVIYSQRLKDLGLSYGKITGFLIGVPIILAGISTAGLLLFYENFDLDMYLSISLFVMVFHSIAHIYYLFKMIFLPGKPIHKKKQKSAERDLSYKQELSRKHEDFNTEKKILIFLRIVKKLCKNAGISVSDNKILSKKEHMVLAGELSTLYGDDLDSDTKVVISIIHAQSEQVMHDNIYLKTVADIILECYRLSYMKHYSLELPKNKEGDARKIIEELLF